MMADDGIQAWNGQSSALAALLRPHARGEGMTPSPVPQVCLYRADRVQSTSPVIYQPCVVIVVQGEKRGYFRDITFTYDPSSVLAFSVPLPIEAEIRKASADQPFLAVGMTLEPAEISDILIQTGLGRTGLSADDGAGDPQPVTASPLTPEMSNAVERLIRSFDSPAEAAAIGPLIRREILYRVLASDQGGALRAVVQRQGNFHRIADLMRQIHQDCTAPISVADMAGRVGMSQSTFFETFKGITSMTPLQYVKSIRLHEARALMLNERVSASTAATRVGYQSASQFSREFKRFFGVPPSRAG
ncbi:MAG: AraC family transcriptional regulator [Alphaproteobacteria bacterium]|nr:AraC family transcriptional regulator [Alphaproteobacteria bacterium]